MNELVKRAIKAYRRRDGLADGGTVQPDTFKGKAVNRIELTRNGQIVARYYHFIETDELKNQLSMYPFVG